MSLNVRVTNPVLRPISAVPPPGPPPAPAPKRSRVTVILVPLIAMFLVAAAIAVTAWLGGRSERTGGALGRMSVVPLPALPVGRVVQLPFTPPASGLRLEATVSTQPQDGSFVGLGCWTPQGAGYVFALRGDGSAGMLRLGTGVSGAVALTPLRPVAGFVPGAPQRVRVECSGGDAAEPTVMTGFVNDVAVIALGLDASVHPFSSGGIWRSASSLPADVRDVVLARHQPDSGPPPFLISPVEPAPSWADQPAGAGLSGSTA